ncbi:acetamidase/formamidase family protein [Demequina sp. NBRC 110053]|uniref:acetamidase/formamidase family protein n=1 Tax=Demequina sp. NBRC 110053 TaxID=1570342 RepID=UPI000A012545|nr:acetamidase/formamidase family protein [Demequina sp. NBRC 110053]
MGDYDGILRRGEGLPAGADYVPVTSRTTLWGRLPCSADAPVTTVSSGTTVVVDTLSHEGLLPDQGGDPLAFFSRHGVEADAVLAEAVEVAASGARDADKDGPHVVTGPIGVTGARPGDLLAVDIVGLTPRVPYGVISNRHGRGALAGEMPSGTDNVSVFCGIGRDRDGAWRGWLPAREGGPVETGFPLAPFLGIMGVATATSDRVHSVPPGSHGGNIDIKDLVAGTRLYLPVQVSEALFYAGDPHFAQGDGEVALTALEASLRATLRLTVVPEREAVRAFGELAGPLGESADYLYPTGMDEDLDEALRACVRQAVSILAARHGMDAHLAYAYLSAATDFRISQVVDLVQGVHAAIRISDFEARPHDES